MKQNLEDNNPQMWDLAAYRVPKEPIPHHRTGNQWKIYPTYDFAHCLCDSFEGITHSLCTTEFELSRVSYEWLCDKLKVYKLMQREYVHPFKKPSFSDPVLNMLLVLVKTMLRLNRYGRLNLDGVVLSKRKLTTLVKEKVVRGWNDPRLYTLIALHCRGVPPGAIISFVNDLGVTKATTSVQIARFDQSVRRYLENTVPRLMLVLDPIPVIIENLGDDHVEMVEVPFSKDPTLGVC